MPVQCKVREYERDAYEALCAEGCHRTLARILAAREIHSLKEIQLSFHELCHPLLLLNNQEAGERIARAIMTQQSIVVVGDYDCDGACAVAIAVRGLKMMGAQVSYVVPDRMTMSYGFSVALLDELCKRHQPDMLITVDNGINSHEAVAKAQQAGIEVIITDHHLPSSVLPAAACIVNPLLPNCCFPSKTLSGSGVIFYVLLSVRIALRNAGHCTVDPPLISLLDLVCIGTLADLVSLDRNNRILISGGIHRMRQGLTQLGVRVLLTQGRCLGPMVSQRDLVYAVVPRINAAGRLSEIGVAIECLLADDEEQALLLGKKLDKLNRQRRLLEKKCYAEALIDIASRSSSPAYVLYQESWHLGLVGLLANRIKDKVEAPVLVFGRAANGEIRGSGRAPVGYHLHDLLTRVQAILPEAMSAYGGHAQAVGLSVLPQHFEAFERCFLEMVATSPVSPQRTLLIDGALELKDFSVSFVTMMRHLIWGAQFPSPVFCNYFQVDSYKSLGAYHLQLSLRCEGRRLSAYYWYCNVPPPEAAWFVYEMDLDSFYSSQDKVALTILAIVDTPPERDRTDVCSSCYVDDSLSAVPAYTL